MKNHKLPVEQRELVLLETARATDLASLLDARELTDYMRASSPITAAILKNLKYYSATEQEFETLHSQEQSRQATVSSGSRITLSDQANWDNQLRAVMGEKRFAAYETSRIPEFQYLFEAAARNGLPVEAVSNVYASRQKLSEQSQKIGQNRMLTEEERTIAMTSLARDTRNEITRALGAEVAQVYLQSANLWIRPVERGEAVTFHQSGWNSVRPPATIRPRHALPRKDCYRWRVVAAE